MFAKQYSQIECDPGDHDVIVELDLLNSQMQQFL